MHCVFWHTSGWNSLPSPKVHSPIVIMNYANICQSHVSVVHNCHTYLSIIMFQQLWSAKTASAPSKSFWFRFWKRKWSLPHNVVLKQNVNWYFLLMWKRIERRAIRKKPDKAKCSTSVPKALEICSSATKLMNFFDTTGSLQNLNATHKPIISWCPTNRFSSFQRHSGFTTVERDHIFSTSDILGYVSNTQFFVVKCPEMIIMTSFRCILTVEI